MVIIFISAIFGVVGTAIGALIIILIGKSLDKLTCIFLAFASGIMISLSFFVLIPDTVDNGNMPVAISAIVTGCVLAFLLDTFTKRIGKHEQTHKLDTTHDANNIDDEIGDFHGTIKDHSHKIFKLGIGVFIALAIHKLPEGIAMGASVRLDSGVGSILTIVIGLHNIPEGMALSTPLLVGGMKKLKVLGLSVLAGLPTVLGTVLGYFVSGISPLALSILLGISSGVILFLVFVDIVPEIIGLSNNRVRLPMTILIGSTILGLIIYMLAGSVVF